jgi:hypothetical protein
MNLRVDLILETEQRSASIFNLKTMVRAVAILIPSIIAVFFLVSFFEFWTLKSTVNDMKTEEEIKKPKVARADALRAEVDQNETIKTELQGRKNSAIDWHVQFVELMKLIPDEMHFDSLRMTHTFASENNVTSRKFDMTVAGKSQGTRSEDNVLLVKRSLTISDFFKKYMNPPDVPVFKQDTDPGAKKTDRIFRIECNYKPRKMQ